MLAIRTKHQSYQSDAFLNDFQYEMESKKSAFIKLNGELIKKSEILGVKEIDNEPAAIEETNMMPEAKRRENIYVLTYLKAHVPRLQKEMGKLSTEDIRAVIAQARASYSD